MSTPFDTRPGTGPRIATRPQLERAIKPMLDDRNWQAGPEAYVTRCAAIKAVLSFVTDYAEDVADNGTLSITGEVEADFAAGMAACAAAADPQQAWVWKPLTVKGASALIDWLGQQPWAGTTSEVKAANVSQHEPTAEDVPAGRYAVATEDGATNALAFYKVDRPTEGRWAGYTFVKLIVSDDEQRLSRAASQAVLAKIAEVGPAEASALYGHEIGSCGVCGKVLTNDESRARGIGPVCAARVFGL